MTDKYKKTRDEWKQLNKDYIKEYSKEYYLNNQDKIVSLRQRYNIKSKADYYSYKSSLQETYTKIMDKWKIDLKQTRALLLNNTLTEILSADSLDNIETLILITPDYE